MTLPLIRVGDIPDPILDPIPTKSAHGFDVARFRSFDLETHLATPGRAHGRIVCASIAARFGGEMRAQLLDRAGALEYAREYLEGDYVLVGANIAAFDLMVLASEDESLLPLIFRALREGRVFDVLLTQSLDAIAGGHLGRDPRTGGPITNAEGRQTSRYSLHAVVDMVLGRLDAKKNDAWRMSYGLLDGIPHERWPEVAREYPINDAVNTLEVAEAQMRGWNRGIDEFRGPARNIGNLPAQCEAAFALALGAAWGLRTDGARVEALAREVEEKHRVAVERFQKKGWIRPDGTEDQAAVKRAVAEAYGASAKCRRCGGTGKVRNTEEIPCRGVKLRGRFQGCGGATCSECRGGKVVYRLKGETICRGSTESAMCAICGGEFRPTVLGVMCSQGHKMMTDGESFYAINGCDGSGYDLSKVPMLPRTPTGGIGTDRDTAMESGDDDVSDYANAEWMKERSTYVPYLRRGAEHPLTLRPNTLVATGRVSYDDPIQQFPRDGSVRGCVTARPGYYLGSTDYAAGELCTLSQVCLWLVGESKMVEVINATKDPGSLHTMLAAQMMGVPFAEAKALVDAGDARAKQYRQAAKAGNFGLPGGMGSAKFVLSKRKKSEGKTRQPNGVELPGIRFCLLLANAERCGAEKITEWRGHPTTPVCKQCVEIVEEQLKPAFFSAYPEVRKYLKLVGRWTDREREGDLEYDGAVPCMRWNAETREVETIRLRGGVEYTSGANNAFQALLSDIGKTAYAEMTREAYLGVTPDGHPSPLVGVRFPLFLHDEPLSELPVETAHLAGPRIAEIMMAAGRAFAPDVTWVAETALAKHWSKAMSPVYDANGRLLVWEPKRKAA